MRRPLIAGNWKMMGLPEDGAALARQLAVALRDPKAVDLVVFPPFLSLAPVVAALRGTAIAVGGQDLHPDVEGAHTGSVSGPMLKAVGCTWVLVGHSERRAEQKEDDALLGRKVRAALRDGLTPILCVGELLDEREAGRTLDVVRTQLAGALQGLTRSEVERLAIAYEPVWAIGTGKVATPAQAQDVHAAIRAWLGLHWDAALARSTRIVYGGSVKAANARELLAQEDIDGALVGGASLDAASFAGIAAAT